MNLSLLRASPALSGRPSAWTTTLVAVWIATLAVASALAADGLQPAGAFRGAGPSGELVLCCPPQIMLCIFTQPIGDRPGAAPLRPRDIGGREQLAEALIQGASGDSKHIRFMATGGSQDVDALDMLYLVVASNANRWRVVAQATDLVGAKGVLPANRLSTCHWHSGGAYVNLGPPIEVAAGGIQPPAVVNAMYFRARVEAGDPAGNYSGKLSFTGLICP